MRIHGLWNMKAVSYESAIEQSQVHVLELLIRYGHSPCSPQYKLRQEFSGPDL